MQTRPFELNVQDHHYAASDWLLRVLVSAASGAAASIPMAFVMGVILRMLPSREQYALPPEEITLKVASRTHLDPLVEDKPTRRVTTWLAHVGYGAATATLYPLITGRLRWPPVLRGMLFALTIWAASYMGWLPAARILPPAGNVPAGRNITMIVSHLVWGALIGMIVNKVEEK